MHAASQTVAKIGPNAVLQHVPVLDATIGPRLRLALLTQAGVDVPAPDAGMVDQDNVVPLHRAVWLFLPDRAAMIQRQAGLAVGDYILAHRIPPVAQGIIRALPGALASRVLASAIARHAWTFAGSGQFSVVSHAPLTVSITGNPLAQGPAQEPSCHWHAAVFERLFQRLVWPQAHVCETQCCAQGAPACTFVITPRSMPAEPHA